MITRKIKIGKFFDSHSRSIQNIAHHIQSKNDGVISEGGGVCMSFFGTQPNVLQRNEIQTEKDVESKIYGMKIYGIYGIMFFILIFLICKMFFSVPGCVFLY